MKTTDNNQTVLISGASSGIGYATALHLANSGMNVFAGVRKEADKEKLQVEGLENLNPVILDVCKKETIQQVYETLSNLEIKGPFILVNNAGVSLNGPLEILPMEDIENLIQVNVTGLLALTQAFLPLIRRSQGRLINISSGHGLVAIPDKSAYAASKSAVQAISDSLRVELMPFGVKVCNIVVGKVNTEVLGKILNDRQKMIQQADPDTLALYTTLIEYFDREVKNIPGIEALEVAKVIARAITEARPKAQYLAGPGTKRMLTLSRFPKGMRDNMLYKAIYNEK